jgi:flagellar biogenesis protein FliO
MRRLSLAAVVVALLLGRASVGEAQTPYPPPPALLPEATDATPLTPSAPLAVEPGAVRQAVAISPPDARANTPLSLPAAPNADAARSRSGAGSGFGTMLAALGVVLGLFLAVVALMRRGMPAQARMLPKEAVEVLGRTVLPGRRQGHLIRVGNKIALVSFSTGGADTLVEITDPAEVDRLAGLCLADDPQSATNSFRGIVEQFFKDKPAAKFVAPRHAESDDV